MGVFMIRYLCGKKNKKGFTLIELVVVIAILGVISSIAIPRLSGFSEKARVKADEASLSTLNKTTSIYAALNNISGEDIFAGVPSDDSRMSLLVSNGLLGENIKAQQKDTKFVWDIGGQLWTCSHEGAGVSMTEAEAEEKGFAFSKGTGTITGYTGSDKNVEIPSKIGGVDVTTIGEGAFKDKELESVVIGEGVIKIEEDAFRGNKLTDISIPSTVTTIGDYAFIGKQYNDSFGNELESVIIPGNVTSIGKGSFKYNKLTHLEIPGNVTTIHTDAFAGNKLT